MRRAILPVSIIALTLLVASAAAMVAVAQQAEAAFPGANGRITFHSFRNGQDDVFSMNPDGTDQRNLIPDSNVSGAYPEYSPDAKKIAFQGTQVDSGPPVGPTDIFVINANGTGSPVQLTDTAFSERGPAWSPDGTEIAFVSDQDGNQEIYVMDADGTNTRRLTFNAVSDFSPAWSPDGSKIAFSSFRNGDAEIWVMNADGSTVEKNLTNSPDRPDLQPSWSPDGSKIAFDTNQFGGDVWVMNADGTGQRNLTPTNFAGEYEPAWSPSGRKIAYARKTRDAQPAEIYVMRASDGLGRTNRSKTPTSGEGGPNWGPYLAP
jgi:Tol biopolymer transport system component